MKASWKALDSGGFLVLYYIMKVNLFKSSSHTSPSLTRDVSFFLDRIREGKSKDAIYALRQITDEKEQGHFKRTQLPAVAFNGTFSKRGKDHLKEHSGLMTLDFDDFNSEKEADTFKAYLKKDKHVFAAWFSPRKGIKALYRIRKVKDDAEFKEIYNEVKKVYPELDPSGKDISRLCYESYDPDIYVNLEASVYSPVIVLEKKIDYVGTVTNIPLTQEDDIVNRLRVWFEREIYDPENRNTSIYILSSAFNKFGVSKQTATEWGFRYAKPDAPEKEVHSIIESAYKNTADWNTKSFEDKKRKKKLSNMIASGKTDSEIKKSFSDIPEEKLQNEVKSTRKNVDPDVFWEYDFNGEPKIKPFKLKTFLESKSFAKYYPDDGSNAFIFITKDDNFLDIVSEYQIKDFVLKDLQDRYEIDIFDIAAEKTKIFTYQYLSILDTANVEVVKDGKDYAMLYYQNKAVRVEKDKITELSYNDLEGYVWRNNIITRDYKNVDHHESEFRSFVWYISGQNQDRYNSFKSIIGYLLHSYKNSANNKAIILNDEKISDNPNGGSGKGLLTAAIGKMKNLSVIDGKTFDFTKSFPYQTVSTDSQVLAFDDAKKNFKFEQLFSLITEGITLEYKGKDAIKLSVEKSPKILISTNYTIESNGGSFERRMFEIELSNFFSAHYTPMDQFGRMMFDEWDSDEWARFDKYMINCLQYYLENGLVAYEHVNLKIRKITNSTSREFVDFMKEQNLFNGMRVDYRQLKTSFTNDYRDFEQHKWFTQNLFNKWLGLYFEFAGFKHESIVSNGQRVYEITAVTDEAKSMKEQPVTEIEEDDGLAF